LREGGCGAPGVPHPGNKITKPSASVIQPFRGRKTIAVSLMEPVTVSVFARVLCGRTGPDQSAELRLQH
jgi:hypothetical protein